MEILESNLESLFMQDSLRHEQCERNSFMEGDSLPLDCYPDDGNVYELCSSLINNETIKAWNSDQVF